jgi:hypothetical protein
MPRLLGREFSIIMKKNESEWLSHFVWFLVYFSKGI